MIPVTPLILTYNEAPNIERTLERLQWAREIVVVDSGSTDGTLELLSAHMNVRVVARRFDSFARQCNFGLEQVRTEWVLSLDADYVLTPELADEIKALDPSAGTAGYRAAFRYCIFGKPLRGTLYPPRCVLYRKALAHYEDDGHGHRVRIDGPVAELNGKIDHDDRKPLSRWFDSQRKYAALEAEKLIGKAERLETETLKDDLRNNTGKEVSESRRVSGSESSTPLSLQDKIRRTGWLAPFLVLPYCLIVKRGILDGWAGWFYALQRLCAEVMLAVEMVEKRLKS